MSPLFAGFIWESVFSSLNKRIAHGLSTSVSLWPSVPGSKKWYWPSSLFYSDLTIKSVEANCISVIHLSYKFIWTSQKMREKGLSRKVSELLTRTIIMLKFRGSLNYSFHVVWSSSIEYILVFKKNKTNPKNFVWTEAQRYYFFLGALLCISLSCSESAHTTLKGRSKFVLFVVQDGWLGASFHLKAMQLFSSVPDFS